jgi:hypothetical protein
MAGGPQLMKKHKSSHWYTPEGKPAYNSTLTQARKFKLKPSVTTILGIMDKYIINQWKVEQAIKAAWEITKSYHFKSDDDIVYTEMVEAELTKELSKASKLGSKIHWYIERYLKYGGLKLRIKPEIQDILRPFVTWFTEINNIEYDQEIAFTNNKLGFGGKIDCTAQIDGQKYFIDWKTQFVKKKSPVYYSDWAYQLSAYRKCYSDTSKFIAEENGYKCMSVVISTNPDNLGLWSKVWDETKPKRKNGMTLKKAWSVFTKAKSLFKAVKGL